jgi:hypothetical protein
MIEMHKLSQPRSSIESFEISQPPQSADLSPIAHTQWKDGAVCIDHNLIHLSIEAMPM